MISRFIKHNSSGFRDALYAEARGLESLRAALEGVDIRVPRVFNVDRDRLELERVSTAPWSREGWRKLGAGLAALHLNVQNQYGLDGDNYIGLNPQKNCQADSWGEFFVDYRLRYQVCLITDSEERARYETILEAHQGALVDYLNAHCEYPSLVHGDLWSGNVLCDRHGAVWLIDPAVYYGDREVDIAMSEMFGGFHSECYRAYGESMALSAAYPQKREIYNLYHYLNHYNLFGDSYLRGCRERFDLLSRL